MDTSILTQLGPYGGIIAVLIALASKWFAHKRATYRLTTIRRILEREGGTAEEKQKEAIARLQHWDEDDRA